VKTERGFTLLEVMIAVSIMAVGIVGALELFGGSLKLAGDAGRQSQAAVLARALVDEELWRDVLEDNERAGTEGLFSFRVVTHPIERELVGRNEQPEMFRDPNSGELGLWLIRAEVRWQGLAGPKSLEFETARLGQIPE
jgi:prepilin-type N-terminal cleavage/methylation domain-containing protein